MCGGGVGNNGHADEEHLKTFQMLGTESSSVCVCMCVHMHMQKPGDNSECHSSEAAHLDF